MPRHSEDNNPPDPDNVYRRAHVIGRGMILQRRYQSLQQSRKGVNILTSQALDARCLDEVDYGQRKGSNNANHICERKLAHLRKLNCCWAACAAVSVPVGLLKVPPGEVE